MGRGVRVTSVTLNWNGEDVLPACIRSLKVQTLPLYEIIVVDNGSSDQSIERIRDRFPEVIVIENGRNAGAPAGRNVGLSRALDKDIDYLFTLDNDLQAAEDCVEKLVSVAESDTKVGSVGAFIYDAGDRDRFHSAGGIVDFTQNITRQLRKIDDPAAIYPVSYVGTGHMLTRAAVFREIGLLDERYIGYGYEDTDFGIRTQKAGYTVCTFGQAKVWHQEHESHGRMSFKRKYLFARSAIEFMKCHAHFFQWVKYLFYVSVGLVGGFFIGLFKGGIGGVYGKFLGICDGLLNRKALALRLLNENSGRRVPLSVDSDQKHRG